MGRLPYTGKLSTSFLLPGIHLTFSFRMALTIANKHSTQKLHDHSIVKTPLIPFRQSGNTIQSKLQISLTPSIQHRGEYLLPS
jgi:hypothetical protein